MTSKQDLDLAKQLLAANVLDEKTIRAALTLQAQWLQQGKAIPLDRVLYARKDLPAGALAAALGPSPLETQPFPDYRLDALLGEGGLALVYSGVYLPNDTRVAVKVLDPIKALRDVNRERFEHEAALHIELEHDNVVAGYEAGFAGGFHYYSMDLVEGETVLDVIERRGRLTNEEALSIALQVASALEYLHGQGLIHRDVKPGNIMVDESGWARLLDLGLVGKMVPEGTEAEGENILTVGTVEYLSPEQARGRADLDERADIYSLGMTIYHMVVGEVAFQGESDYEVMAQQILSSMDTQKIKTRRIDPEIYFLITKMSAKERDERWRTLSEAIPVIDGYLPHGLVAVDLGEAPPAAPQAAPPAVQPVAPPASGSPAPPAPPATTGPTELKRSRRVGRSKDGGAGGGDEGPRRTRRRRRR